MKEWFSALWANIVLWFNDVKADFILCFVDDGRWKMMVQGLGYTLIITFCALMIGLVIGIVIAAIRSTYDKNKESMQLHKGFGYHVLRFFNGVCHVYLTVVRGTPVVVQLLIMYFIVFASSRNSLLVAIIKSEAKRS